MEVSEPYAPVASPMVQANGLLDVNDDGLGAGFGGGAVPAASFGVDKSHRALATSTSPAITPSFGDDGPRPEAAGALRLSRVAPCPRG